MLKPRPPVLILWRGGYHGAGVVNNKRVLCCFGDLFLIIFNNMSFLSEIKTFDGKSLKAVDINLTTAGGKKVAA